MWLNTDSFVAFVQVAKATGRHSAVLILLVNQVGSGCESGRSVLEKGGYAQLARPTLDHKSDILLTAGRLTSFFRESALEAHSSAWPGRVAQVAMMFVVLTPEFNTLGNLLPLPTARDSDAHSDTERRRRLLPRSLDRSGGSSNRRWTTSMLELASSVVRLASGRRPQCVLWPGVIANTRSWNLTLQTHEARPQSRA